jgi:2'-5' RNA ligase
VIDASGQPLRRLFFALDCPPEQRRAIARWRSTLELRAGRPVPAENFHLTLLFLGAIAAAHVADICTAAAEVRVPGRPVRLALDRLDVWRRSGVMVLAAEQAPPELLRLVYALEQAMLPFGLEDRPKEFRPHLTLMRDYRAQVPESTIPPEFHLRAEHFALYESCKGGYRVVAEWPLLAAES